MKHLFPACLFFIFLISCDNKSDDKNQVVTPSVLPVTTNPFSASGNDSLAASNAAVVLNPEHGKPGHRCDIAVGAPLNGVAINSSNQPNASTTIAPAKTNIKQVIPNSNTTTGALNPQHGQPGHRCDIAVGAPLDSKPTQ
jgi:uncharacterized protein YvpB